MNILIRLPNWLGDILLSFPFLHALKEEFPAAEITCIVKPAYQDLLELLPFKVQALSYDRKRDGIFPGAIKRLRTAQKLAGEADIYFCLPPSFSAAFMGCALKARARVGYAGQWRSLLLTHTAPVPEGMHRYQQYMNLLKLYTGRDIPAPEKTLSHSFDPYFRDAKPYVAVNINSEASSRRMPLLKWAEYLELFEGQRFVFIGEGKGEQRVKELLRLLNSGRNEYVNLAGKTSILDLARLLAHCKGLLSNDSGPAHLGAYVGAPVVVFFGAGDPLSTAPAYAGGKTLIISEPVPCSPCLKNECHIQTLDCLNRISMPRAMSETCRFLNLG